MNYTRADYEEFYNDRQSKRGLKWWQWAALWIAGIIGLVAIAAGCDGQAAQITAQAEQVAHEKKLALVTSPCGTWICQKHFDHEPCGRAGNTACAESADLRSEK